MATATTATRPRNRKQLIVEAAGRVFHERGYHAAAMEDIAASVGITAAALYRHFPNKYALFVRCANAMADRLLVALDDLPADAGLEEIFTALAQVTLAHRRSGGVYRWEARYLDRDDRRHLRAKFAQVVDRVSEAVRREHSASGAELRATAALGAIGSVTMHRTSLGRRRTVDVLVRSASRVAASVAVARAPAVVLPEHPAPRTRREQILAAAIPLFERDGFANVSNGRIAEAVGVVPSAIYRHYPSKADILSAACLQAADLLKQAVQQGLRGIDSPDEAVRTLARTYVAYSFEHTALTSVAEAEIVGLPPAKQRPLIAAQREHIAVWEHRLRAARPELDARKARVLVHAGLGVVVEAGRRLHWEDDSDNRDAVASLVLSALGC